MIFDLICCGVIIASTLMLYIINSKLMNLIRRQQGLLVKMQERCDEQDKFIQSETNKRWDRMSALYGRAEVREETEHAIPSFEVFYRGELGDYVIKRFPYFDPDDREYKRIHAEEVAEILNEKP